MEILQVLANPILPVFAIMVLGFGMGRAGHVSIEDARTINRFAMSVLIPIMVFDLIANAQIYSFSPIPMMIYAGAQAAVFLFGYTVAMRVFRCERGEAVLLAFGTVFANNVLYVVPIAILIYGESEILPLKAIITWDSTVTFAAVVVALQLLDRGEVAPMKLAATMAKTPILQGIALGMVFAVAQLPIPAPIQTFLDFNGSGAAPVALFALGVVMSGTKFGFEKAVLSFTLIKLLIFPAVVWIGFEFLAAAEPGRDLFLLGSAGPAGAMAFSLALLHGIRTDAIAQVIVLTSILTLASLAILA